MLVEIKGKFQPEVKLFFGSQGVFADADISDVLTLSNPHSPHAFPADRRFVQFGVDPSHDAVAADGDANFAVHHECDAAEHFLLLNAAHTGES